MYNKKDISVKEKKKNRGFRRYFLYLLIVLLFCALQFTDGLFPKIFGCSFFLTVPLIISIGMFDYELSGAVFGLIAGAYSDFMSAGPDGIGALFMTAAGCVSGLLLRYYMMNKIKTFFLLSSAATFLYAFFSWFFDSWMPVGDKNLVRFLTYYLPSAIITVLFSFITYYIVKAVHEKFTDDKEESDILRMR